MHHSLHFCTLAYNNIVPIHVVIVFETVKCLCDFMLSTAKGGENSRLWGIIILFVHVCPYMPLVYSALISVHVQNFRPLTAMS